MSINAGEGREVVSVRLGSARQVAAEGTEGVADWGNRDKGNVDISHIGDAHDMDDWGVSAKAAGVRNSIRVSSLAEITRQAGDIRNVRIGTEGAYGWDQPGVFK